MRDKHRYRVHRYRVQSGEKLPRRPVWHSIYSASLGWEVLRLIQVAKHRRTFGKHRASWPNSTLNFEKKVVSQSKDHTAVVNKRLPDLHWYQTWGPSVCVPETHPTSKAKASRHGHRREQTASMSSSFLKIPFPQHHYITEIAV